MSIVRRLALPVLTACLWATMTLFGAIVLETFMVCPNVFAGPPQSLGLAVEFLAVSGPSGFFPPLGFAAFTTAYRHRLLSAGALGERLPQTSAGQA